MFGPRINTVFASRYRALWWASVVLVTAYCSIPSSEETAAKRQQAEADAQAQMHAPADDGADDKQQSSDYKKAGQASDALRKLLQ